MKKITINTPRNFRSELYWLYCNSNSPDRPFKLDNSKILIEAVRFSLAAVISDCILAFMLLILFRYIVFFSLPKFFNIQFKLLVKESKSFDVYCEYKFSKLESKNLYSYLKLRKNVYYKSLSYFQDL